MCTQSRERRKKGKKNKLAIPAELLILRRSPGPRGTGICSPVREHLRWRSIPPSRGAAGIAWYHWGIQCNEGLNSIFCILCQLKNAGWQSGVPNNLHTGETDVRMELAGSEDQEVSITRPFMNHCAPNERKQHPGRCRLHVSIGGLTLHYRTKEKHFPVPGRKMRVGTLWSLLEPVARD